jgi:hypothetical protein
MRTHDLGGVKRYCANFVEPAGAIYRFDTKSPHQRLLPSGAGMTPGAKVSLRRRDCKHKTQPARVQSSSRLCGKSDVADSSAALGAVE